MSISKTVDEENDESGAQDDPNGSVHHSTAVKQPSNGIARQQFEQKFIRLRDEWKSRKSHSACVEDAVLHPAYLRIIGMGPDVVPLILAELERKTDHWFCALYAITEADPVPEEGRGVMRKMVETWIEWGKKQGYRW